MRNKGIFKSTAIYGLLNFLHLGSRFLLFPIFVNYLRPVDFGIIGLHSSVASFMTVVISFGLDSAYTRGFFDFENDKKLQNSYFSTIFLTVMLIGVLIGIILFFLGPDIFEFVFKDKSYSFYPFGWYAFVFGLGSSLNAIMLVHLRNREEPAKYFLFSISIFLVIIILESLVIFGEKPDANKLMLARTLGLLLPSFVFWIVTFRKNVFFESRFLRDSFSYASPMFVYAVFGFTYLYIDRIIVGNILSLEILGIYTAGLVIASVLELFIQAIDLAIVPVLFRFYNQGKFTITGRIFLDVSPFVYLGAALILGISPFFITYFAPEHYLSSIPVIPIFLLGFIFRFLFGTMNKELYFHKKVKLVPWINLCAGLALIGSSVILIPRFGLFGAAGSMAISRITTFICAAIVNRLELKKKFEFTPLIKFTLLIIPILLWPAFSQNFVIRYGSFYISGVVITLITGYMIFSKLKGRSSLSYLK